MDIDATKIKFTIIIIIIIIIRYPGTSSFDIPLIFFNILYPAFFCFIQIFCPAFMDLVWRGNEAKKFFRDWS